MISRPLKTNEALADGLALVRDAWRDLWPVQTVFAFGLALMFLSQMGKVGELGGDLFTVGLVLAALTAAPLYSALYRIEIGGPSELTLGPGGLQLGWAEARLWALWTARATGFIGMGLAATALAAIAFVIFKPLGVLNLGPLGTWQPAFFIAAALWLTAIGLAVYAAARLSLGSPASIDQERLILSQIWPASEGLERPLAAVWIAVRVPALVLLILFGVVDSIENGRLAVRAWRAFDAGVFGLFAGGVLAFMQAPLAVGAVASLYRHAPSKGLRPTTTFAELAGARPLPQAQLNNRPDDPVARFRAILGDNAQPFGR